MAQHVTALSPSLQGKPVVARIHADWCPACKATQSTIDGIKAKYGNKIAFVQFDVTDGKTSAAAAADAKRLGLAAFFDANKTKTSTVAVVNPKTGAIVATFYDDTNAADYESAIERAAFQLQKT
jgi:thiol-disulfide isomerase/thioredoxin